MLFFVHLIILLFCKDFLTILFLLIFVFYNIFHLLLIFYGDKNELSLLSKAKHNLF